MPEVSVIVPVYNVEKYLSRCVDSILAQTFSNFELILVDDGSPDRSGEICDEYAAKDSRIRVIHQENAGASAARNRGVKAATGEFVAFVDSDDYIEKEYLETYWENRTDLTLSGFSVYNEGGKFLYAPKYEYYDCEKKAQIDYVYLCDKLFSPVCRLFRRDVIIKNKICFPLGVTWGEDAVFGAEYFKYVNHVRVLPYQGYHYIKYNSENSLSSKVREDIVDTISSARERYLSCLEEISGEQKAQIRAIMEEDIINNCAYFVVKLFQSKNMSLVEKERIFRRFSSNTYVQRTIQCRERYYRDENVKKALGHKKPMIMYCVVSFKTGLKNRLRKIWHLIYKILKPIKDRFHHDT